MKIKFVLIFCISLISSVAPAKNVILITGGANGLGREIAEVFYKNNWKVYITTRTPSKYKNLKHLHVMKLELTDASNIKQVVKQIITTDGKIDILVNNAGDIKIGAMETTNDEDIKSMFAINYFAVINMIKEVLPSMRIANKGHIINISSTAALSPSPGFSNYAASKAALETASIALAAELSSWNIKVSVFQPGCIKNSKRIEIKSNNTDTMPVYQIFNSNLENYINTRIKYGENSEDIAREIFNLTVNSPESILYSTTAAGKSLAYLVSADIDKTSTYRYQRNFALTKLFHK